MVLNDKEPRSDIIAVSCLYCGETIFCSMREMKDMNRIDAGLGSASLMGEEVCGVCHRKMLVITSVIMGGSVKTDGRD